MPHLRVLAGGTGGIALLSAAVVVLGSAGLRAPGSAPLAAAGRP